MCHQFLSDPSLFSKILFLDLELFEKFKEKPCEHCGGFMDVSNFLRKPRGLPPELGDEYHIRFSLCCRSDGCRKRHTPPSLRFFGRKVWIASVFLAVSMLSGSCSAKQSNEFLSAFRISKRLLKSWRKWWANCFSADLRWKSLKAFMQYPIKSELPEGLSELTPEQNLDNTDHHIWLLQVLLVHDF